MPTTGKEPTVLWMWVEAGESFFPIAWPGQAQAQREFYLTDPLSLKGEILCSFVCLSLAVLHTWLYPIRIGTKVEYALCCKKFADLHVYL